MLLIILVRHCRPSRGKRLIRISSVVPYAPRTSYPYCSPQRRVVASPKTAAIQLSIIQVALRLAARLVVSIAERHRVESFTHYMAKFFKQFQTSQKTKLINAKLSKPDKTRQ